jgi:hypothetical protein
MRGPESAPRTVEADNFAQAIEIDDPDRRQPLRADGE